MGNKLTGPQMRMLRWYADHGPTTQAFGRLDTWASLVRRGLLAKSSGLGAVGTEITETGRWVLEASNDPTD